MIGFKNAINNLSFHFIVCRFFILFFSIIKFPTNFIHSEIINVYLQEFVPYSVQLHRNRLKVNVRIWIWTWSVASSIPIPSSNMPCRHNMLISKYHSPALVLHYRTLSPQTRSMESIQPSTLLNRELVKCYDYTMLLNRCIGITLLFKRSWRFRKGTATPSN